MSIRRMVEPWKIPHQRQLGREPSDTGVGAIGNGTVQAGVAVHDCDITKKGQSDQARLPRTQVKRDHLRPEGKPPSPRACGRKCGMPFRMAHGALEWAPAPASYQHASP